MNTLEVIKQILLEKQDIDPSSITESATFDSLGLDSLDMVEMICDLEEKLDIDFGDPEDLKTLGDVVKYVDSLK